MPGNTSLVRTAADYSDGYPCEERSGLEMKMERDDSDRREKTTVYRAQSLFLGLQEITKLPDDLIAQILLWKGLTLNPILTLLKEERRINNTAVSVLKSDKLWQPLFEKYFPDKNRKNQPYFDLFKHGYRQILDKVKQSGWALYHASAELQADREVVLEAVNQSAWALQYASAGLQADREVVLEAVKRDGRVLEYASAELRAAREVVLEAVKQNGLALEYASAELRADREVVLEAVKQNGRVLEYASSELRADREVVLEAVKRDAWALEYASAELRAAREVVLEAVKQNGARGLKYASVELQADREVVLEAVKRDGWALEWASAEFRVDREFVLEAVKKNRWALECASTALRNDPQLQAIARTIDAEARARACDDYLERNSSINPYVFFGFIDVVGAAAMAIAFMSLNAATFGAAGLITAGSGAVLFVTGSAGIFETYRDKRSEIEEVRRERFGF